MGRYVYLIQQKQNFSNRQIHILGYMGKTYIQLVSCISLQSIDFIYMVKRHRHLGDLDPNLSVLFGRIFETSVDALTPFTFPSTLVNGVYTFIGNEKHFKTQADNNFVPGRQALPPPNMGQLNLTPLNYMQGMAPQPGMMMPVMPLPTPTILDQGTMLQQSLLSPQPMMPLQDMMMMPQMTAGGVHTGKITLHGLKTKSAHSCCFMLTLMFGIFLILPLFFMCCEWWKKIQYPLYELTIEAYRDLANFIAKHPTLVSLEIITYDNALNSQKARILYEALSASQIRNLKYTNKAFICDVRDNQGDTFIQNMKPIKSLNMTSEITWGPMKL